jgi:tetratricopeptide (TPR) repeat protein/tRNA A-37 threonylcarbamoyl transferase component Bud32
MIEGASAKAAVAKGDAGLPLGAIIPGSQYRVITKLGAGGMGSVYAAEHVALEKRVALKVLRSDTAHPQQAIDRLRDEARAASKIGSEFICDVTDFGQTPDGRVFLVMEYLEGQSLGRVLREGGPLKPERALPILRQIAKALEAAHEKGIVHLDVKPDNVMLLPRGRRQDAVKVVDFGIARLLGRLTREDNVTGTPEYVAPERFVGAAYDHRADIYAFGILAYETLTGVVPFRGPTPIATFTMHVEDAPPPMVDREGRPLPAQLSAAIMEMLEKDPAARPASMAIVEAMLCEAQIDTGLHTDWDDLELPAVDETWRKRLAERMPSPWGRQKKIIVGAALALALAGTAVSVYYGVLREPDVVVKYVALTKTEEADSVATWLEKAQEAADAKHYSRPADSSALTFIQRAEAEQVRLRGNNNRSKGADDLRRRYASALSLVGDELAKAGLPHLATPKYKEALLFAPTDATLLSKAELSADEQVRLRERTRPQAAKSSPPRPAPAPTTADEAKEAAGSAYLLAARQERFSEARLALRSLANLDKDGWEQAKLADAFRRRADELWAQGQANRARPFYQLTAELDPLDVEAKRRGQADPGAASKEPAKPSPAAALEAAALKKAPVAAAPVEDFKSAPRDPKTSHAAVDRGKTALGRLSLQEAETSFNLALEADPSNAAAIAGLAEVAFERSRYTDALDYARRAVQQAPRTGRYHVLVGDAYFKLLRYADAKAAYERALRLGPGQEMAKSRLERLRIKLRE